MENDEVDENPTADITADKVVNGECSGTTTTTVNPRKHGLAEDEEDNVDESDCDSGSCSSYEEEEYGYSAESRKRPRIDYDVSINEVHLKSEVILDAPGNGWINRREFDGNDIKISTNPFLHCQIDNFLSSDDFMGSLIRCLDSDVLFTIKFTDLFQFRQSEDLSVIRVPEIVKIRELFQTEVLSFVRKLTGIPLNGKVDMFLSDYQEADHLLCHDDELEERRIAFILYFNTDWKQEYGGTLDLFACAEEEDTKTVQPTEIVKSIPPLYNRFVFFDVTHKSFHQVSEITELGVSRYALSGWFYGDPVPRPPIVLPPIPRYSLQEHSINGLESETVYAMENFLDLAYTDPGNQKIFNKQLEEESEAMLIEFFKPEVLRKVLEQLKETPDPSNPTLGWRKKGPATLCNYWIHGYDKPFTSSNQSQTLATITPLQSMINFFHSKPFLKFLESILEMPFTADSPILVNSELRKFEHKCYTLLKSENSEIDEQKKTKQVNGKHLPKIEKEGSVDDEEMEDEEAAEADSEMMDEEEDEQGNIVDLIYYFGEFDDWDEVYGGQTIYIDGNGEQVMSINPTPNSLAIVVRTQSVNSYVNYVNYLSQKSSFYAFTMSFRLSETELPNLKLLELNKPEDGPESTNGPCTSAAIN